MKKKVLITGAMGFIGTNLTKYYRENDFEVYGWDVFDCLDSSFEYFKVDMTCCEDIEQSLKTINPDYIIHCAGSANVSNSFIHPHNDFYSNVISLHNLLFSLQKLKMNKVKFVFLSSAAVYGNPKNRPINEDSELNPLSPYALHKVICEQMCEFFIRRYDFNIKIARIFSAYGVGLKKQIFWDMHTKLLNTKKLEMFGTGNESRDFIEIRDLVNAIFLISQTDSSHIVFNVANGIEISINYVAELFARNNGYNVGIIEFNGINRQGDPLNWVSDISRLSSIGYAPSISIDEGVADYCLWAKGMDVSDAK